MDEGAERRPRHLDRAPGALGLRQNESEIGHHGDPDQSYGSVTFGQATPDRRRFEVLDVIYEQTLAEAIALADAWDTERLV